MLFFFQYLCNACFFFSYFSVLTFCWPPVRGIIFTEVTKHNMRFRRGSCYSINLVKLWQLPVFFFSLKAQLVNKSAA